MSTRRECPPGRYYLRKAAAVPQIEISAGNGDGPTSR